MLFGRWQNWDGDNVSPRSGVAAGVCTAERAFKCRITTYGSSQMLWHFSSSLRCFRNDRWLTWSSCGVIKIQTKRHFSFLGLGIPMWAPLQIQTGSLDVFSVKETFTSRRCGLIVIVTRTGIDLSWVLLTENKWQEN